MCVKALTWGPAPLQGLSLSSQGQGTRKQGEGQVRRPAAKLSGLLAWIQGKKLDWRPDGIFKVKSLSRIRLFATPWTAASQAPPSTGFSRQEYCSGLRFPSPEDRPNSGIKPGSAALQVDALPSKPRGKPDGLLVGCKFLSLPGMAVN